LKTGSKPQKIAESHVGIRLDEGGAAFDHSLNRLLASSGNFTLGNATALSGLID
jgi:hypothetical protein